jgi:hypothetical protein
MWERPSFIPIQNNLKKYDFVNFRLYIPGQQAGKQKTLDRMVASIPEFSLLLISSFMQFWSVSVVPKYFNFATSWKDLFSSFILCLCPAFWQRDTNIHLAFSWLTTCTYYFRTFRHLGCQFASNITTIYCMIWEKTLFNYIQLLY